MPGDDYLARSGAKELLTRAVAEILTLRPRAPVHALAHHFQAIALGHSAATAARALRASHASSRAFPDAAFRVFCELADASTAFSTSASGKAKALSAGSAKAAAGSQLYPARSISASVLAELLGILTAEFPKRVQTLALQRFAPPEELALTGGVESSAAVGFDAFLRAVDTCLQLEELLDAASELFQLLHVQCEASAAVETSTLADQLQRALQAAATQFPAQQELLDSLLACAGGSDASQVSLMAVSSAVDAQEALAQLALGSNDAPQ